MLSSSAMPATAGSRSRAAADDLGAPAAVVGDVAQRRDVDAVVAVAAAVADPPGCRRLAAVRRRLRYRRRRCAADAGRGSGTAAGSAAAAGRSRRAALRPPVADVLCRARRVDADRVDQHFGLANQLLHREHVGAAARVVAVRDDDDRLLAVVALLREAAPRRRPRRRARCCRAAGCRFSESLIRRLSRVHPSTSSGALSKRYRNTSSFGSINCEEEAIERLPRGDILSPSMLPLVSSTMPRLTGTRSALKCVTVLRLLVVVDAEVVLGQAGDEAAGLVGHRRGDVDQLDARCGT